MVVLKHIAIPTKNLKIFTDNLTVIETYEDVVQRSVENIAREYSLKIWTQKSKSRYFRGRTHYTKNNGLRKSYGTGTAFLLFRTGCQLSQKYMI